ncbi:hypothetical protein BIWAKO_05440 [Bosea sp. BIWAKO-01]|nr:hypothetical protein BIWAKO_05440 [Bosea sp. BIWAKO-01]
MFGLTHSVPTHHTGTGNADEPELFRHRNGKVRTAPMAAPYGPWDVQTLFCSARVQVHLLDGMPRA